MGEEEHRVVSGGHGQPTVETPDLPDGGGQPGDSGAAPGSDLGGGDTAGAPPVSGTSGGGVPGGTTTTDAGTSDPGTTGGGLTGETAGTDVSFGADDGEDVATGDGALGAGPAYGGGGGSVGT